MSKFQLNNVPGFSDIPDASLAAEAPASGSKLARISDNAALGMVRPEFFYGIYKDGETVLLPKSDVDGYQYSRDELLYIWCLYNTVNAENGWITGPGSLWYGAWKVDQAKGTVSCEEYYRTSSNDLQRNSRQSNDGVLGVFTVGIRGKSSLTMATAPSFVDRMADSFATDQPLKTGVLTDVSHNAKFSVVNSEVIYMGEFTHGQTIPKPVSPIDGYVYDYEETNLVHSWRWTTQGDSFSQPDNALNQLHRLAASIAPTTGAVTLAVTHYNSGALPTTHGRIAVFAFCSRSITSEPGSLSSVEVSVPGKAQPWMCVGQNTSFNFGRKNGLPPVSVPIPIAAGQTVTVSATGSVNCDSGEGSVGPAGGMLTGDTNGGTDHPYPTHYMSGSSLGRGGLCGAFTDALGNVVQVRSIGAGGSFVVPAGAVQLQLGINDDNYSDNSGSFDVTVSITGTHVEFSGTTFAELDPNLFVPPQPLPGPTVMAQIQANAKAAICRPEFFPSANYTNGQTVPLPVSPLDGYHYTREELYYLWEWANTGPEGLGHIRIVSMSSYVDGAGNVSLLVNRLLDGGSTVLATTEGSVSVTTVGLRSAQFAEVFAPSTNYTTRPPTDTVAQAGGEIYVNGQLAGTL